MQRNLKFKIGFIAVIVVLCIYGIIGVPKSIDELVANWKHNIHLGLDLRGGSHLVLQVQVQDAFKAEADQTIERLKEELRKAGVDYTSLDRNDPADLKEAERIQINIKGVPVAKTTNLRTMIAERFKVSIVGVDINLYRLDWQ